MHIFHSWPVVLGCERGCCALYDFYGCWVDGDDRCDILIVVLNHDPALLRTFLVHQPQHTLFSELVGLFPRIDFVWFVSGSWNHWYVYFVEGMTLAKMGIIMSLFLRKTEITKNLTAGVLETLQVWGMLTQSEGGLQAQLLEIMRMLLDSETMDTVFCPFAKGVLEERSCPCYFWVQLSCSLLGFFECIHWLCFWIQNAPTTVFRLITVEGIGV